ncbi:MAG: O-antigen ligase family protein, partial [Candidatus Binatia bacterium]
AADRAVAPAERERIRELAAPREGWFPASWRAAALYPFEARSDLLRYLAYGLVMWLAATVPAPGLLLRGAVVAVIAVAALALVQFATWNGLVLWFFKPYDWRSAAPAYPRMVGPFVNPDQMAAFLAMGVPPVASLIAFAWRRKNRRRRDREPSAIGATALGLGLTVIVAALAGSASRGGIAGAMLGAVAFWWGAARTAAEGSRQSAGRARRKENRADRLRRLFREWAPVVVGSAIVVGGLLYAGPRARTTLDVRLAELAEKVADPGLDFRFLMWRQSLPILADFPLFGVGAGGWREVFRRYEEYPIVGYRPNHAHSDYLEWLAEVGAVGAVLTVLLVLSIVRWARGNESIPATLRWGMVGGLVAIAWHEAIDFNLRIPANALLASVLAGLLCNRSWAGGEAAEPRRRGFAAIAIALVALGGLGVASVQQFREFTQWARVRAGSPVLAFAPQDAETWYELAMLLYRSGFRYSAPTEDCLRAAIHRRPTIEKAYRRLSLTAATYEKRRNALEAALFLDPTRARWRLAYALVRNALGQRDAALAEIEEAVYRDPQLRHHAYLQPGTANPTPDVLEAAERGFRRAVEAYPGQARLLEEAATFFFRFEHWADAAELWTRAGEIEGEWSRFGLRAGESYARLGDYARAEKMIRRAIGEDPAEQEGYRSLALFVYAPQKDAARAEEILDLGLRRARERAPLLTALYEIRSGEGDRKAAVEALAKAAELEPRDLRLQLRLGSAYLELEDYH